MDAFMSVYSSIFIPNFTFMWFIVHFYVYIDTYYYT